MADRTPVKIPKQANALTHNGVDWRPRSRFPKSLRPRYARDKDGNHWRLWYNPDSGEGCYTPVTAAHLRMCERERIHG